MSSHSGSFESVKSRVSKDYNDDRLLSGDTRQIDVVVLDNRSNTSSSTRIPTPLSADTTGDTADDKKDDSYHESESVVEVVTYTCKNCGSVSLFEDLMEQRCDCFEIVDRSLRSSVVHILDTEDEMTFKIGHPFLYEVCPSELRIDYFGGPTSTQEMKNFYVTKYRTNSIPGDSIRRNIATQKVYDDFITMEILRRDFLMDHSGAIACITCIQTTILPKIISELIPLVVAFSDFDRQYRPMVTSSDVRRASACLQNAKVAVVNEWVMEIASALKQHVAYAQYLEVGADDDCSNSSDSDDSEFFPSIDGSSGDGSGSGSGDDNNNDYDDSFDLAENVPGDRKQFTDIHDDSTDTVGIDFTATEKCQFEKCFGFYPTLFIDGLEDYSLSVKTSYFYPCAMFKEVRTVLALVLSKVRYLRAVDVYHWDIFVGILRRRLADSAAMVVFQQRDTAHFIREFLLPGIVCVLQ